MAKVKGGRREPDQQMLERIVNAEREFLHLNENPAKTGRASAESCFETAQSLLAGLSADNAAARSSGLAEACYHLYLAQEKGDRRAGSMLERVILEHTLAPHQAAGFKAGDLVEQLLSGRSLSREQALELNGAYHRYFAQFLMRVQQSSPLLPPQVVPDYCLGILRPLLDSPEVTAQSAVESQELVEAITSYFSQAHPSPAENLVNVNFSDFFSWTLSKGETLRRIFGMPSEAACRIGLAYLEGRELPRDRVRGAQFIMYAVLTGSARACIAWNLFYEAFDYLMDVREDVLSFERYGANLLHGMMLCVLARRLSGDADGACVPALAEGGSALELDLFKSAAALLQLRRDYSGPHTIVEEVQIYGEYLSDAVAHYGIDNIHMRVCAARMLDAIDGENRQDVVQKWRLKFKLPLTIHDALVSFALLKTGLAAHDEDAQMTLLQLHDLDYRDKLIKEALDQLLERGFAKAAFMLGNYWWIRNQQSQGVMAWFCGAEMGSPMALYNAAVTLMGQNEVDRAEKYARKAARSGIPQAFYMLYQCALRKKLPQNRMQHAYTWLRYAADFAMKDARAELERMRESGKYRPLPFMRDIEKIEQLAQTDETAAVFMGSLYSYGVVMPRDRFMSLKWFRHAAELGDLQSAHFLSGIYSTLWEYEDNGFVTSGVKHALDVVSRYGIGGSGRSAPAGDKVPGLVRRLYSDLRQGKSVFEQQLFHEAELSPLWNIFNARGDDDGTAPEIYFDPEAQFYSVSRVYTDNMLNTCMFDYDETDGRDLSWRVDLEAVMRGNVCDETAGEIYQKHVSAVRAITSVRGLNPPDPEVFARECRNGFNADSVVCYALIFTKTGSLRLGMASGSEESGADQEYFDMTLAQ